MKVVFSKLAVRDLQAIGAWISADRPNAARKLIHGLQATCAALAKRPHAYQLVEGREGDGMRRAPYTRYVIYYREEEGQIQIVRILDGARDIASLL